MKTIGQDRDGFERYASRDLEDMGPDLAAGTFGTGADITRDVIFQNCFKSQKRDRRCV